jgi:hypothetical protein
MVRRVEDTLAISIGTDLTEDRGQGLLIPFPSLRISSNLCDFLSHHIIYIGALNLKVRIGPVLKT